MVDCSTLPNPTTPLAFLPPALASQLEVSRYLHVATCGMFSWEILINLRSDYKLLTGHRLGPATIVYFISKIASFAYVITGTAFTIGTASNCEALEIAIAVCLAIAIPATTLLFFFRIRAIFYDTPSVINLFALLWIGTVAGCIAYGFALYGTPIGPTRYCQSTTVRPISSVAIIISTVNDTLVFLFISWRFMNIATIGGPDDSSKVAAFFRGRGLPALSRALLQSGQEYYLITVGFNLLAMAMILAPKSLPTPFHAMFICPTVAVTNIMACRVYRDIKFGLIKDGSTVGREINSGIVFYKPSNTGSNGLGAIEAKSVAPAVDVNMLHTVDLERGSGTGSEERDELEFAAAC